MKRDNSWLQQLLDAIWDNYFTDVPQLGIVRIEFGRRTRNRLGSLKLHATQRDVSIITINGLFRDPTVPQMIVEATIVHELSHYAHGFNSPLEQRFRHPHAGGVMRQEFASRGLEALYREQKQWLKLNWAPFVNNQLPRQPRRQRTAAYARMPKPFWL